MKKRILHTIIPNHFKSINNEDNGVNIKLIYWELNCLGKNLIHNSRNFLSRIKKRHYFRTLKKLYHPNHPAL